MLQLDRGEAMRYLTTPSRSLASGGRIASWTRARSACRSGAQRVFLLASRTEDPARGALPDDAGEPGTPDDVSRSRCGFYWTEGIRGLGWAERRGADAQGRLDDRHPVASRDPIP